MPQHTRLLNVVVPNKGKRKFATVLPLVKRLD